jgi:hypothetical protein
MAAKAVTSPQVEVTKDSPSKAEIAAYKKLNPAFGRTLEKAQAAFGDLTSKGTPPGKVLVTTSAGNGGQPVVTVVPPGFDPKKPAKVQTHYHGDRTSVAEKDGRGTKAIKDIIGADPQQIFVLPEAKGNVNADKTDWSNAVNQKQTTADALSAAGVTNVGERTVSAHSAGGRALAKALETPGGVQADRVLLLDCLYQPAMDNISKGLKANGKDIKEILVVRGTNEPARYKKMIADFKPRAHGFEVGAMKDDPHNSILRNYLDGRGVPGVKSHAGDAFGP